MNQNQLIGSLIIFAIIFAAIWIPSLWVKIPATALLLLASFFLFNEGEQS